VLVLKPEIDDDGLPVPELELTETVVETGAVLEGPKLPTVLEESEGPVDRGIVVTPVESGAEMTELLVNVMETKVVKVVSDNSVEEVVDSVSGMLDIVVRVLVLCTVIISVSEEVERVERSTEEEIEVGMTGETAVLLFELRLVDGKPPLSDELIPVPFGTETVPELTEAVAEVEVPELSGGMMELELEEEEL
jgi:hypothetical protein